MEYKSSSIGQIALALSKAQKEYKPLTKSRTAKIKMKSGGEYSYKYADLSDLIDATREALAKNEIAVTQSVGDEVLITQIIHSSGEFLATQSPLPTRLTPQEFGSALTYYRRYSLSSILGIAGEEDDDSQVVEVGHKERQQPAPRPQQNKAPAQESQYISEAQIKRMFSIAYANGFQNEEIKETIQSTLGVDGTKMILKKDYNQICNYFEAGQPNVPQNPIEDFEF